MTYFPDMGTVTLVAAGPHVRAVGYLDPDEEFCTGDVPARFVTQLEKFVEGWQWSARLLGFPTFLGGHTCEFCGNASDTGEFGVPFGDLLFVAPTLIAHYVTAHRYLPPPGFITAVKKSPPPGTLSYWFRTSRFQGLLICPEDEQRIGDAVKRMLSRVSERRQGANASPQPTSGTPGRKRL